MDKSHPTQAPLGDTGFTLDAPASPIPYFFATLLAAFFIYSMQGPKINLPSTNQKKFFELTNSRPKKYYLANARSIMGQWFSANPNKPMKMVSDMDESIVLPPSMANEIRSHNHLSFTEFSQAFFQAKYPGFEAFTVGNHGSPLLTVINKDLTKQLAKVTEPLAGETSLALKHIFTENKYWHAIHMRPTVLQLIARVSSRVFLGTELCRNEAWLDITKNYTLDGFTAADRLREYPLFLRAFVHWFLPVCQSARRRVRDAATIIQPIIDKRNALKAQAVADGRPEPEYLDAIDWFEKASKAKGVTLDPSLCQLFLSTVAIHTTTDLLGQVLVDLAKNPDVIKDLQKEVITTLNESGWKKNSLYNMKLMDSVIKESQRLKPLQLASMQRIATADVTLSDGTFIPKGACVGVSSHALWDPEVYPEPEKWDGYRFYRLREEPGKENFAQLVSTAPEHLGFGHGKHACPGRFFAANEIKIVLAHILLQYEWRLPVGAKAEVFEYGNSPIMNPQLEIEIRRRADEVDLEKFREQLV
ncbi:Putative cytochrome P450 [Colletotrichum destructivum]|uniref:Cytochrome P450 n=1 Tax=Colletotrichum destructivum TaxID=34406 RepID=A0AAX4I0M9_9PEZI|nr:Putative cytochrome P450 [Colletotrichum destructivum]